jgi:hypothetical protein
VRRRRVQRQLIDRLPPGMRAEPLTPVPTACLHLPPMPAPASASASTMSDLEWLRRLRARGLVVEPLSGMHWVERRASGLVLGYGDWSDAVLDAALEQLVHELHAAPVASHATNAAGPHQPVGEKA